ncbi:MAG TPA: hypothetical protein VH678_29870 [Xanthobacteraceae bacterium]
MMSSLNRGSSLRLLVGVCALAISTGLSAARAQDTFTQEASAVSTDARASAPQAASDAPAAASSATQTAIATEPAAPAIATEAAAPAEHVTPLKPVEVRPAAKQAPGAPVGRPYFIEFRARAAYNYGHAFVVHGRVGEPITKKSVVGLHPAGDSPIPWMIGHIIPVPSETGWSDGDVGYNDIYITAKYRVYLTEAEYRVLLAHMREMQSHTPLWSAPVYNCVAFVGDIAAFLGMQHPFHWVMPKEYIEGIRAMNGGRQELPAAWLERMNPQLARQSEAQLVAARHQAAESAREQAAAASEQPEQSTATVRAHAEQQAAPTPAKPRNKHRAAVQSSARPQASAAVAPAYAVAQ